MSRIEFSPGRRRFLNLTTAGLVSAGLALRPSGLKALTASELPVPLARMKGDWQLTFEDSFDDPAAFDRSWERLKKGGHNHPTMRYPQNVVVEDGEVDLRLGHQDDPKKPFTGGYIQTRTFRQCYGYFECDMRIPNEDGVNNAFWLTSDRKTEGSTRFELDVAEVKYPNSVQLAARRWKPNRLVTSSRYISDERLYEGFHRYAMLWTQNSFRFYVDDWEVYEADNSFAHTPAIVLLSNAVAPFAGETDGDVAGAATTVQNVRVFQNFDSRKP